MSGNDKVYCQKENERNDNRPEGAPVISDEVRYAIEQMAKASATALESCAFSEKEVYGLKREYGLTKDLGGGDVDKGIDFKRENHHHVGDVRSYGKDAKRMGWKALIMAIVAWVIYTLWPTLKVK